MTTRTIEPGEGLTVAVGWPKGLVTFSQKSSRNAGWLAFAAGMGLLWLGTVPLTNGLVGQIYGLRYAATLYGVIFFGHQIGSFIGVWLGGLAYARTGSYDPIWWAGIALALLAAALSWPIDERPLARRLAGVARTGA